MKRVFEVSESVAVPFRELHGVMRGGLQDLIGDTVTLHGELGSVRVEQDVRVSFGLPEESDTVDPRITVPIRWLAVDHAGRFPTLEGRLVADWVGDDMARLTLTGTYRPPLRTLGATADAVSLHHVAQGSLERFVHDVVSRLRERHASAEALRGDPLM